MTFYPQYYSQPSYQQNNSIIWVQGEAGAKSYLIAPNTTVQLWDSESQTIYLKSADASGMPTIKILDYTIRSTEASQNRVLGDERKYVSEEDLEPLREQINALEEKIKKLHPTRKGAKNESALSSDGWD